MEGSCDKQREVLRIDRLGQEIQRPHLHGRHRVFNPTVGRHHDDWNLGIELLGGSKHPKTVARLEPQVSQNKRRSVVAEQPVRLRLAPGLDDRIALPLQRMAQHCPQRVFVLDQKGWEPNGRGQALVASQRSQPGGTPARCASSSMSAMSAFKRSISSSTRCISDRTFWRSIATKAR